MDHVKIIKINESYYGPLPIWWIRSINADENTVLCRDAIQGESCKFDLASTLPAFKKPAVLLTINEVKVLTILKKHGRMTKVDLGTYFPGRKQQTALYRALIGLTDKKEIRNTAKHVELRR